MSLASAGNRTGTDRPMPPDLFADVRYFINVDVDAATQDEVSIAFGHRKRYLCWNADP